VLAITIPSLGFIPPSTVPAILTRNGATREISTRLVEREDDVDAAQAIL
jgi:hypothetical protein